MSADAPELARLETLPTEILQAIVDLLPLWNIKDVSCTSKRLRGASLTPLFRHVTFKFSQVGIKGLNRLLESEIRSHVTSFNYEVPELLKTDILDFDRFKSNVLTPDSYVDLAKGLFDGGCEDECPSYSAIYKTVHKICREQHNIVNEGADLVLLSLFEALPQLSEVKLCFGGVLEDYGWVLQFLTPDMVTDEFYQHHLQVVTSAIRRARTGGIAILPSVCGLSNFHITAHGINLICALYRRL